MDATGRAIVPAEIGPVPPPARRRGQLPLTTDIVTFPLRRYRVAIGSRAMSRRRRAILP